MEIKALIFGSPRQIAPLSIPYDGTLYLMSELQVWALHQLRTVADNLIFSQQTSSSSALNFAESALTFLFICRSFSAIAATSACDASRSPYSS